MGAADKRRSCDLGPRNLAPGPHATTMPHGPLLLLRLPLPHTFPVAKKFFPDPLSILSLSLLSYPVYPLPICLPLFPSSPLFPHFLVLLPSLPSLHLLSSLSDSISGKGASLTLIWQVGRKAGEGETGSF